jgi:hypothetical protein
MSRMQLTIKKADIRRGRLAWALACFALLTAEVIHETVAYQALERVRSQATTLSRSTAASAYRQHCRAYPLSLSVIAARQELRSLPGPGTWTEQAALSSAATSWPERLLGRNFSPDRVDWLPLWGWLCCGLALLAMCATRLATKRRSAVFTLEVATLVVIATVVIWGWYGFPLGRWWSQATQGSAPVSARPMLVYIATWIMIAATGAMLIVPMMRGALPETVDDKVRPSSPNDPRMALLNLKAQMVDQACTGETYAQRRAAILDNI